jgi:uncharacterized membrane protein HdeD (DUF308 family)
MKTLHLAYILISAFAFALAVGLLAVGIIRILRRSLLQERTFNWKLATSVLLGILAYDAVMSCFELSGFFVIVWFLIHLPSDAVLILSVALGARQGGPYLWLTSITVVCCLFSALFWAGLFGYLFRRKLPPNTYQARGCQ